MSFDSGVCELVVMVGFGSLVCSTEVSEWTVVARVWWWEVRAAAAAARMRRPSWALPPKHYANQEARVQDQAVDKEVASSPAGFWVIKPVHDCLQR